MCCYVPGRPLLCALLLSKSILAPAATLCHPLLSAGEGGCLRSLQSLHLESLKLAQPIPPVIWCNLAPGLTSLTWRDLRVPDEWAAAHAAAAAAHAAAHAHADAPDAPSLFRPVALPRELSALQGLRQLAVEYARLDAVPPALQALTRLTALSLEGNRISSLPEGRYLTSLRRLSLACNAFTGLPEGLTACSRRGEGCLAAVALQAARPGPWNPRSAPPPHRRSALQPD